MKKTIRLFSAVLMIFVLFSSSQARAKGAIPVNNLSYPVQVILDNGLSASGFFVRKDNKMLYFVTAKHMLFGQRPDDMSLILRAPRAILVAQVFPVESKGTIEFTLQLEQLAASGNIGVHPGKDVAVIKIAGITGSVQEGKSTLKYTDGVVQKKKNTEGDLVVIDLKEVKLYNEISLSNEVFIFGYPTSLGMKGMPQLDYRRPLLRKGIVAGKNDENKTIILDCPAYYGNSGGPCIEVEELGEGKKRFLPIGVVTQFIPFEETWLNVKHQYTNVDIENSGYSVVEPMDTVIAIIEQMEK